MIPGDVGFGVPLCGETGYANAAILLDGQAAAQAGETGRYRIYIGPSIGTSPAGLAAGEHVLVASAAGARTKAIRFREQWLRETDGCRQLHARLDPRKPGDGLDTKETGATSFADADGDSIDDFIEDWLSQRFAPIVHHGEKETNFPVSVDQWLRHTNLWFLEGDTARRIVLGPLSQGQLTGAVATSSQGIQIESVGMRSRGKRFTFFLEDVPGAERSGSQTSPSDWITYVHSYPNESGGVTLQYWRAYTWNGARALGLDWGHGGDWEGVAIHLDVALQPEKVVFLQHAGIVYETDTVRWEGTHPLVWSSEGGHSTYPDSSRLHSRCWIRQETWNRGRVTRWDGVRLSLSGGLLNLGEKSLPRNGQAFVQYSGLWGSRRRFYLTSGYWGPAFNETGARCADGTQAYPAGIFYKAETDTCAPIHLTAWCDGISAGMNRTKECQATFDAP